MTTPVKALASTFVHFLDCLTVTTGGGLIAESLVTRYGQELTVNDELRRLNTGTDGCCWLDLADDEEAQHQRWGRVLFRSGPWPANTSRMEPGSPEWLDAREAARLEAWKVEDEHLRAERLRAVVTDFGPLPKTSWTLLTYDGTDAR